MQTTNITTVTRRTYAGETEVTTDFGRGRNRIALPSLSITGVKRIILYTLLEARSRKRGMLWLWLLLLLPLVMLMLMVVPIPAKTKWISVRAHRSLTLVLFT